MNSSVLIYPHHLFEDHPALPTEENFVLIEEPLFFTQFKFHKQKLAFHRISMREYESYLKNQGKNVLYLDCKTLRESTDIFTFIPDCERVITCDVDDDWLTRRMRRKASELGIAFTEIDSPGFLNTLEENSSFIHDEEPHLMASFYKDQRNKSGILMKDGKPVGGKWSFDAENRKKLPRNTPIPIPYNPNRSSFLEEEIRNIHRDFAGNPGELDDLIYPTNFREAKKALDDFLQNRFMRYGEYQDAIVQSETFLFHSLLSPLINSGLLTPCYVIQKTLTFADKHDISMNSVEGFVRQVIGWREFVRGIYAKIGRRQRTRNFWRHSRKIPKTFWNRKTGIDPVDRVIERISRSAYCHHIERLMVMGNFMLLCEFDPDEVYRWFMELFIDAYDWVMVPNVYGMSQYADGGLMATKPYFSSSNYLKKMSDFKPGPWCAVWDGLFWRFIHKHRNFFASNPRLSVMVLQLERISTEKLRGHLEIAEEYLRDLDVELNS